MNKNDLLRQIQMYDFLVVEARLFLDTHPKNKQ
ncbi:MAG: spore coat protein CotJB, partial [Oscillospiraceae bacterium]